MRQLRYYIDTSVWNFMLEEDRPAEQAITERFFSQLSQLGISAISDLVLDEIHRAAPRWREALLKLITTYHPEQLQVTEEAKELADRYVQAGLIPAKYLPDALHLSTAVVHNFDVVVSWNFEHMVKLKTRLGVNGLNKMLGYREIEIVSPQEVITL